MRILGSVVLAQLLFTGVLAGKATPKNSSPAPGFQILEAIHCRNKPNLLQLGIKPLPVIRPNLLWPRGVKWDEPNERRIRSVALQLKDLGLPIVIGVDHWPLGGEEKQAMENAEKYIQMMRWLREEKPNLAFGYFGVLPVHSYLATQKGRKKEFKAWRKRNAELWELGQAVKVIFLPLYTFLPDRDAWKRYAKEHIKEARRHDRPVYVFLWPKYHESNAKARGRLLTGEYWALQLETCRKYADGIVIALDTKKQWDESADWWLATKVFLATLKDD